MREPFTLRNSVPSAVSARKLKSGRWLVAAAALMLALGVNGLLVAALAGLNQNPDAGTKPESALSWYVVKLPNDRPELRTQPRVPDRQPEPKVVKPAPAVHRPVLRPKEIRPRAIRPRAPVVARLKVQPDLVHTPVEVTVSVPDIIFPALDLGSYSVEQVACSYDVPEAATPAPSAEPPEEAVPPPPEPKEEAGVTLEPEPRKELPADDGRNSAIGTRKLDRAPQPVRTVPPHYPALAKRRGLAGNALVRFQVDERGAVVAAEVVECTGHSSFGRAALNAVRRWRFRPATYLGEPVSVTCLQTIRFELPQE